VERLLSKGARSKYLKVGLDIQWRHPMAEASHFGNASIVRMILELEAETYGNPKGRDRGSRLRDDTVFVEAMQLAVLGSYHDIVRLLLD
jgi:hypothetical protein